MALTCLGQVWLLGFGLAGFPEEGAWLLVLTNRTGWSSFWTAGNIPSKSELPKIGEIKGQPAGLVLFEGVLDKIHVWWCVFSSWETSQGSFLESNPIQPFAVISAKPRNYYYFFFCKIVLLHAEGKEGTYPLLGLILLCKKSIINVLLGYLNKL